MLVHSGTVGAQRQAFLLELGDAIRDLDDPVAVQATASRMLGRHLESHRVLYAEITDREAIIRDDHVVEVGSLVGRYPLEGGGDANLMAWRRGGVTVVDDVQADPSLSDATRAAWRALEVAAYIAVTLLKGGRWVAALAVHSAAPRRWTPAEVELACEVTDRTWAAVQRAHAEIARCESERRYVAIFENAPFATALVRLADRTTVSVNLAFSRLFGFPREELIGRPGYAQRIPDARTRARLDDELAARGSVRDFECAGATRAGAPLALSINLDRVALGGEDHVLVTIRDLTEQKRLEAEQRVLAEAGAALVSLDYDDALRRLLAVLIGDLAHYATLFVAEDDGGLRRCVSASRDPALVWAAEHMLALPPDPQPSHPARQAFEARRSLLEAFDPDRYEAIAQAPEHLRALRAAGPRGCMVVPLLIAERCVGVLGAASAARRYEARDLRLLEEIARRCALFIENARLHRAEQLAIRARDEMLAVVAHDLRSPLNAIALQGRLLGLEPERRSHKPIEVIERAVGRMTRIITDLLAVPRLDAGRLELEPARVPTGALLAEIVETQRAVAAARHLDLRLDVPGDGGDLPAVWADRGRLFQVFENLIANALKVMTRGSVAVGARPAEGAVLFWVTDTGPGISEADLPHVFDRFWQARQAPRGGGAGLGLAIVRGLVEAHRGRVWAESRVGAGATFFFTVPVAPAATAEE